MNKSRRVALIVAASVALVAVITTGAVVGYAMSRDDGRARSEPGTVVLGEGSASVQITHAEMTAIADAMTAALRAGDADRFVAAIDPAARGVLTKQRQLFANLRKVDFAHVQFRPFDQSGRAIDRFGRSVRLGVDVAFVHQIKGYDPNPVEEWYRWTVVKKDAASPARITAVGAAPAERAGESESVMYPAPWDVWPDMRVHRTEHTLFLVDAPMLAKTRRYAPVAEKAARQVLAAWDGSRAGGGNFDRFVSTLVPDNKGLRDIYQVIKGEATEAGRMMPMSHHSEERRVGSTRSVFDASSGFFRSGDPGEIFRHEYAHAVIEGLETYQRKGLDLFGSERWVVEGFAEFVANLGNGKGFRAAAGDARVRRDFDGKLPGGIGLDADADVGYYLAHQAYRYIEKEHGRDRAFAFAAAYYRGVGGGLDGALQATLGVNRQRFEQGWAAFVRADAR